MENKIIAKPIQDYSLEMTKNIEQNLKYFMEMAVTPDGFKTLGIRINTDKRRAIKIMCSDDQRVRIRYQIDIMENCIEEVRTTVKNPKEKKEFIPDILIYHQKGMRQVDIADRLGITQGYVSKVIRRYKDF